MSSELITLLEREAATEREKILAEARAEAEKVVAEARRQAEELLAAHKERLEAETRAARVRAQSTAHLRASSQILRAKEEEIAQVFAAAEGALARIPSDGQRYPAILSAFITEGLGGLENVGTVTVNPADVAAAQAVLKERGASVTVQTDPPVVGGVKVTSPDGRFVLTNTLSSRLERARPIIAADVAKALWES